MKLTRVILEHAITKALENARELFEDAEILKTNNRYPRAYTLYHLSMEEIGKVFITLGYLLENDYSPETIEKFDKEYRNHKIKIKLSPKIDLIVNWLMDNGNLTELKEKVPYSPRKITELNNLKNTSLYSSIKDGYSAKPSDVISLADVEEIEIYANYRLIGAEQFCELFLKELDKIIDKLGERA